jgi:hypothetical protein
MSFSERSGIPNILPPPKSNNSAVTDANPSGIFIAADNTPAANAVDEETSLSSSILLNNLLSFS